MGWDTTHPTSTYFIAHHKIAEDGIGSVSLFLEIHILATTEHTPIGKGSICLNMYVIFLF